MGITPKSKKDIIGKKWMCVQPGVSTLYSKDFADYCKRCIGNAQTNPFAITNARV